MEAELLAKVVGNNCRRIRSQYGITQDELARYGRDFGLRWNASKVGDFEAGRSSPTFATVLTVSLALHSAARNSSARTGNAEAPVLLSELLRADDGVQVQLNDDLDLPAALVAAVCEGKPWSIGPWYLWKPTPGLETKESLEFWRELMPGDEVVGSPPERVLLRSGLTEDRLARRLGVDRARLADLSYLLWQRTFSEERDQRAGADANQQKKGRISRELRSELEQELSRGDD
ncbi:MAG: helix-turn-helix transcriptional regulator [Mycolicibacterium cosmeticum]|nr:helix-turn-helix transcriptional regulator [Mycolicibacterium cosmeticum]